MFKTFFKTSIAICAIAILSFSGFQSARGYGNPDPCTIAVAPPSGGFTVRSLSGSTVSSRDVVLGLGGGSASYALVSNNPFFWGASIVPYSPTINWRLSDGYGVKAVYVKYLNSCKRLPTRTTSVSFNYVNYCSVAVKPPQNGFMVTSIGSVNVTKPNVKLGMQGGNAAFMEVSNNSNFSNSKMYAYAPTLDWTLSSGYGNKTVWVRYWNSCKAQSSIAVSISFTYSRR